MAWWQDEDPRLRAWRMVALGVVLVLSALTGWAGESRGADRAEGHALTSAGAAAASFVRELVAARQDGAPRGVWDWPLPGIPPVVHDFDPPDRPWLPGHRGIDLAGTAGSSVRAVAGGTVTYSGTIAGVGIVTVAHADGVRSTYQPVQSSRTAGEQVRQGDALGSLGDVGSHCAPQTCLHLGAVRGEVYLDPLLFLEPWEVSLLPHDQ